NLSRLIAVANPNNPTGAAVAGDVLIQIAQAAPQAAVLVDEAYFEFQGETRQMAMVRRVASPYNVNAAALAVLPEALQDQEYVGRYVAQVLSNRDRLQQELGHLGLHYWPSHANFVLVRVGSAHTEFVRALRERGILVRDRHSDPGCEGCVRLTVGSDEHTQTLIGALRDVVEQLGLRTGLR